MSKRDRRFSRKKFHELIVYLLHKCGPMDESELCWMLFQCDMTAYAELGKSLTGATYIKGESHPIPCTLR